MLMTERRIKKRRKWSIRAILINITQPGPHDAMALAYATLTLLQLFQLPLAASASPQLPNKFLQQSHHHHNHLRPSASHDLPIIDLIESPDRKFDPKPDDLDPLLLEQKLGLNYDPRFMSIKRPLETLLAPNGTFVAPTPDPFSARNKKGGLLLPPGKMPKEIKKLKFRFMLPNGRKMRPKVSQRLRRKLRQFLWGYTYCPVQRTWKDLGIRFWPRWLREGHCYTGPHSCSFPEGMVCKPSKSVTKVLLRWHCQDWDRAKYCKWIPIRYPVIVGCSCSC